MSDLQPQISGPLAAGLAARAQAGAIATTQSQIIAGAANQLIPLFSAGLHDIGTAGNAIQQAGQALKAAVDGMLATMPGVATSPAWTPPQ